MNRNETLGKAVATIVLVIFDLDGVLYDFQPARRLARIAALTGKEPWWIQATIWDSDFEKAAESGSYASGTAYLEEFNRRLGCAVTVDQWVAARQAAMAPRPAMLALVERLITRFDVAVLTNNGALVRDSLPRLTPELCRLLGDRVHCSAEFGARKPEPEVFHQLLQRYECPPSQALFIDDDSRAVAGALKAGLHAVRYENDQQIVTLCDALHGPPE